MLQCCIFSFFGFNIIQIGPECVCDLIVYVPNSIYEFQDWQTIALWANYDFLSVNYENKQYWNAKELLKSTFRARDMVIMNYNEP